jgi:AraC-like DNA-binding protein
MSGRIHRVTQYRSGMPGVEALTLFSDHVFPRHTHDHYGIGIMTAGAQKSWSVIGHVESQAGDVIMCNPGEMHDGLPATAAPRGWRIIYIDPSLVARELAGETINGELTVRPVVRDPRLAREVIRLFAQLERSCADPLAAEESLVSCLMRVAHHHRVDRAPCSCASPSVLKAIQRLDRSPDTPVSLSELAASAGLSRFQLLRGFTKEVGTTPHAYVMQKRVGIARQLIAGGRSLTDAADLAGFADQSHLTREFRKHFGITPGRYAISFKTQVRC